MSANQSDLNSRLSPLCARVTVGVLLAGLVGCSGSAGQGDDSPVPGAPGTPGADSTVPGVGAMPGADNPPGAGTGNPDMVGAGPNPSASPTGGDPTGMNPTPTANPGVSGDNPGGENVAPVVVPRVARLTHFQWTNAVRDLLRLDTAPTNAQSFTPDAIIGFDTNTEHLRVATALREDYQAAAEALAMQVASDPSAVERLLPPGAPSEATERAQAFIDDFGLRAHRRPLTATERAQYLELFEKGPELLPELDAFSAGVALVIQTALQSPYFLYRTELGQESVDGRIALSGYELASKLALATTGSIPDDVLLDMAAAGELDPANAVATLQSEAQRLLDSPGAKATARHLHTQALAISRYGLINRDSANYPEFTDDTPEALRQSANLFLDYIYDENLGVKALLTSPTAFVNDNLGAIYGLSETYGSEFTQVDLTAQSRQGLLTQAGFLALFSGEYQPDPIHRGVFVNEHILCVEVGVPVANIPPLPEPQPNQTNRQAIDSVTGVGTCGAGCHATLINPLGFAFENYDPLGRYREMDNGAPVDASGTYPLDGTAQSFADASELIQLIANSTSAHRCYASNWLSYLNGRAVSAADKAFLDQLAEQSRTEGLSTKETILNLVQNESFRTRAAAEPAVGESP